MPPCFFPKCSKECALGSDKCENHKNRRVCIVKGCSKQEYAGKLCAGHGGTRQCNYPGCLAAAKKFGVCAKHGRQFQPKQCSTEGCSKRAQNNFLCILHGGKRQCQVTGCSVHARSKGLCYRHRHAKPNIKPIPSPDELGDPSILDQINIDESTSDNTYHSIVMRDMPTDHNGFSINFTTFLEECAQAAEDNKSLCHFHRNRRICRVLNCIKLVYARSLCVGHGGKLLPGCTKNARKKGFCCGHGASIPKNRCNEVGCGNIAYQNFKCIRHGGGRKCAVEGCKTHARSGGFCCKHSPFKSRSCGSDYPIAHDYEWSSSTLDVLDMNILESLLDY
ncbi:hypothetical protein THRCLA_06503 [Thraustotheca clavata]|uniref:WRKY19-like zinc finger domain-containing protein n=1 Tax=Thraustotheca clavata TaxID=74557 RepID=A0A1V9ZNC5_9STRA|nr:hypothetical protein THRCLA_06503 [Thraustotheca clavata]